jgi:hypothetical protein
MKGPSLDQGTAQKDLALERREHTAAIGQRSMKKRQPVLSREEVGKNQAGPAAVQNGPFEGLAQQFRGGAGRHEHRATPGVDGRPRGDEANEGAAKGGKSSGANKYADLR